MIYHTHPIQGEGIERSIARYIPLPWWEGLGEGGFIWQK